MSQSLTLCEWCVRIEFDRNVLPTNYERPLGSGARLERSRCPFCRLVTRAFSEEHKDVSEYHHVDATWSVVSGGRWAFHISGSNTFIGFGRTAAHTAREADRRTKSVDTNDRYFIEPTTGAVLDATRVLRWISLCEQMHDEACRIPTHLAFADAFRGLRLLRLIDTEANCLAEKTNLEKYVALSYVWGSVPNFRLTTANRTALLAPCSLSKVYNRLPKTIKDTIILVRRLGCRYLWVDALCLLQNDTEDLGRGVNVMDLIYEHAWLTVVAACGHDANASLPGVQNGTRMASRNTVEIKPGVEMGVMTSLDTLLKNSVYNSRAWTFQELVLSRRVIFFVGGKVFYRCRTAEHGEDYVDIASRNVTVGATVGSLLPEAILMRDPVFDYGTMLFYYTKRALADQNDAPRAMAGIIRRFTEVMKCRFLEGLPTALFDWFIVFSAFGNALHRRSSFPSYSWTGWRGSIDFAPHSDLMADSSDGNGWFRKRTWIIWYKRSPSGVTNLVWDPGANDSFSSQDMTCLGYRNRSIFSDGRPISKQLNTRRTRPTEEVSFSRTVPAYPVLQFWTLSVFYNIADIDVFEATGYLTDLNNAKCGFASLDGFEETTFFESSGPFEVILLSELSSHRYSNKLNSPFNSSHPEVVGQWPYYNVLLLEWQAGIAERRGFGIIFQRAIEYSLAPGPVWKEIFLA